MALSRAVSIDESGLVRTLPGVHTDSAQADTSAVSWGAIVAEKAMRSPLPYFPGISIPIIILIALFVRQLVQPLSNGY